ncbi:MAG: hypothetical protein DHS20C05_21750 [Hyphococcus sp.]|nr:MAG: hypothetical protein DHS20C05_21750 [Marinicaulis sp.]
MSSAGYFTRLSAVLFTAALIIGVIVKPHAGKNAVERAAKVAAAVETTPVSARTCAIGEPALAGPFAPLDDVLSISPLGGVTAPGEVLPAPYIRINTRRGETAFQRRNTTALAPAKADIVALERKIDRDQHGRALAQSWTVHFRSCENISFYYDRLDQIDDALLKRAGGIRAFQEFGGPDHIAVETMIRVQNGDVIGEANGFDVGLHDHRATPAPLERPERYRSNPYARAAVFDAPPTLVNAITLETSKARCPIDYLPKDEKPAWAAKLGDSWGIRKSKGDNACRTALVDTAGAAQGVWFSDSAHNAATTKVSAIALASDAIDPNRLIFSLHGRLKSLSPDLVGLAPFMNDEKEAAAKDFLSFRQGEGRINTPFNDVRDGGVYCYERLRANFVGPLINGVILLERQNSEAGPALLKMEARGDAMSCIDLEEPWAFSGNETVFYR